MQSKGKAKVRQRDILIGKVQITVQAMLCCCLTYQLKPFYTQQAEADQSLWKAHSQKLSHCESAEASWRLVLVPLLSTRNAEATGQWLSHVMISDLALFNFLYLYDVASEVSPMWLTPVYLLFVQVAVMWLHLSSSYWTTSPLLDDPP